MKKSKMLALLLASCFIMASCGTGGTGIEENENGSFTIEVTDQIGRIVNIKAPAKRVVSSSYTSTSLLLALGAGDRIVGIEAGAPEKKLYSLTAPWLMDLPAVSTEKEMDIDAARALEPDLVVIPKRFSDSVVAFEELGIHVVVANPETAGDFIKCITMLGKLTGRGKRAEELIEYYRSKTDEIKELVKNDERPAVYFASGSSYLSTCTGSMYQAEIIKTAGGKCVSDEIKGDKWVDIEKEQLVSWNPQFIFIGSGAGYTPYDIMRDPALYGVDAVKNVNVFVFPSGVEPWDGPSPSSILGVLYVTSKIYPKLFNENEFLSEAEAFFDMFYGIEIKRADLGLQR